MRKRYNYIKTAKILCCVGCLVMVTGMTGCKKTIDIGPPETSLATTSVYTSNTTAEAVVSGLFTYMAVTTRMYNGSSSLALQKGLEADELQNFASSAAGNALFYTNLLNSQNNYYWPEIFSELFTCNSAIEGLNSPAAASLTPAIKQQLLGSVKFTRAFIFFNAVNLYGDVPLALSTDVTVNSKISRSPVATVLGQVIQDLTDAQNLLPDNKYLTLAAAATPDRILPNKQAASALLARVYLYMQDWKNAEAQASTVINASSYLLQPVLGNVFLKGSQETIWQLQSVSTSFFGNADAYSLLMNDVPNGSINIYPLRDSLVKAFESGDKRLSSWVGTIQSGAVTYYYASKYKQSAQTSATAINEYPIMFRLAEQYLIRAEARAQQNNIAGAQTDLNVIRNRAGLGATTAAAQTDLLNAIYRERRIELFTEFGHRWFDLKRTGRLDAVMSIVAPQKGGTWSPYKALMPIPASEISINPNLKQNPGYN